MGSNEQQSLNDIQGRWVSCHLYYHQGLDLAVRHYVYPTVVSLARAGLIDSFFFIRYSLGGPHIRLRLRTTPGSRDQALEEAQVLAHRFLEQKPSTVPLPAEAIARSNELVLAGDPNESDASVYPDNSFIISAFNPEVQRYGGPSKFPASLDLFTISSVATILCLIQHEGEERSVWLVQGFSLLLQQAVGFAVDETELADLVRYGVDSWGERMPNAIAKGSRVFQSQRGTFYQLVRNSLAAVRSLQAEVSPPLGASELLILGAARLSAEVGTEDRAIRAQVGGSQLHMTASRLGLSNAEEVYLSQLLSLAVREVSSTEAMRLPLFSRSRIEGPLTHDLLRQSFSSLVARSA